MKGDRCIPMSSPTWAALGKHPPDDTAKAIVLASKIGWRQQACAQISSPVEIDSKHTRVNAAGPARPTQRTKEKLASFARHSQREMNNHYTTDLSVKLVQAVHRKYGISRSCPLVSVKEACPSAYRSQQHARQARICDKML
jgi:hypothetical protein